MFCSNDLAEKVNEVSLESDEEDHVQPVSKFGLLNIEDASSSDSEPDSDTVSSATNQSTKKKQTAAVKVEDKVANKGAAKKQGNKGKADTKKAKDEDDIDDILAELEAPKDAKSGAGEKKDKKKKKKGGNVEDVVGEADTSTQPITSATVEPEIDYRNMTQEEIAKLMEEQYGEDSEEERKKARGKKKQRRAKDESKQTENGEMEITLVKTADKPSTEVSRDAEQKVDADAAVEAADNVPKPTKKQNKKTQRKQTNEVFVGVFYVLLFTTFVMELSVYYSMFSVV